MTLPANFADLPQSEQARMRESMRAGSALAFRYACPIVLGPLRDKLAPINTATGIVASSDAGHFFITAEHVVRAFEDRKATQADLVAYLSAEENPRHFDLVSRTVFRDASADIAVVRLEPGEASASGILVYDRLPLSAQALGEPRPGEHVLIAGFPGVLRERVAERSLEFNSFVVGSIVTSVMLDRFSSHFEREHWVSDVEGAPGIDLVELGGISGAPVLRTSGLAFELLGVVSQYHPSLDYMIFARVDVIPPSIWTGS